MKQQTNAIEVPNERPNLLDFTTSGQVVIDMTNYAEISFLENFGFSPIENVEQEIQQADTPERAAFLKHYVNTYKRMFTEPPKNYLKEPDDLVDGLPDFQSPNSNSISIHNVQLLHTTAWYMMDHADAEIRAIKRHIDELECSRIAIDNLEELIRVIRSSENPREASARIQKRFNIGYIKAQYLLNLPLSKINSFDEVRITIEKEDYQKRLAFVSGLISRIPSGFHTLDEITFGWKPSDLIIIAARPNLGKTAFGLSMAKNIAIDHDIPVAFFSLELSKKQLMKRLIMNVCELDGESIRTGKMTEEETQRINTMINATKAKPLFLDDTSALSVTELRTKARKLVREHGVKLIIIDYLQLMTAQGLSFSNREEEVRIITHSLKALAKELDIPIIALTQLNRCLDASNGEGGLVPQLSDLRESQSIEQEADMVCFIHRPGDLHGLAEFIVAKPRNVITAPIRLRFNSKYAKFENNN